MRLRFACPGCEATVATGEIVLPSSVRCSVCGASVSFAAPVSPGAPIDRCLACGGVHLYVQKEFPRRLGLTIVVLGAATFLVFMGFERVLLGFATLGIVALIDGVVYRAAPLMTVCYHCQTEFRRAAPNPSHKAFDPKIGFYTAKKAAEVRALDPGAVAPRPTDPEPPLEAGSAPGERRA